jgi:hypothetical protein
MCLSEIKRLDANTIARENQPAAASIPNHKSEHSAQAPEECARVANCFLIEVRKDVCVARRRYEMPMFG